MFLPLYEYQCRACGVSMDIRHGFDETNREACPACGGELRRVFSASGIVFKGSGFYINDSKKSSGGGEAKPSASASGDAKPAESDAKPAGDAKAPSSDAKPSGSDAKPGAPEKKSGPGSVSAA